MDRNRVTELEKKIEDLKARMPAHSVPIRMVEELEELEEELAEAKASVSNAQTTSISKTGVA